MSSEDIEDNYNDLLDSFFKELDCRSAKCSQCNKENQQCAPCVIDSCNYLLCINCERECNYGVLEVHSLHKFYKEFYDLFLSTLDHLSTCVPTAEQPCLSIQCSRLRDSINHLKDCNLRVPKCDHCRQVWIGLAAHASHCNLPKCNTSYCSKISEYKRMMNP